MNHIPRPSGYKIYPYVSYEYPQLAEESQKIEELEAELEVTRPVYFFLGYWPKYPGKTLKRAFFLYNASGVRKELEKKKKEYNVLEKLLVDGEDYNQKFGDRSSQSSGGFYWVA